MKPAVWRATEAVSPTPVSCSCGEPMTLTPPGRAPRRGERLPALITSGARGAIGSGVAVVGRAATTGRGAGGGGAGRATEKRIVRASMKA
jgi:hypothetical protein